MTKEEWKKVMARAVTKATAEAKENPRCVPIATSAIVLGYLYEALTET